MKYKVIGFVEKAGDKNYWATLSDSIEKCGYNGAGATAEKAMRDLLLALEEENECRKKEGKEEIELDVTWKMDVGSFFDYYPLNVTAFAKYIGINASLLRQYASGQRTPKEKQLGKINAGLSRVLSDLSSGSLIEKPLIDYFR